MQKNNQGFSLVIGIGLVVVMSLIAYMILAYMHSFMQVVAGVQDVTKSYYLAYHWAEESLYHIKIRGDALTEEHETSIQISKSPPAHIYSSTISSSMVIPRAWFGQSEFDADWNIISQLHPLQIALWGKSQCSSKRCEPLPSDFMNNLQILFRAPKINNNTGTPFEVATPCAWWWAWTCPAGVKKLPILMWTLIAENTSLASTDGSYIMKEDVNTSEESIKIWKPVRIGNTWITIEETLESFESFWNNSNCRDQTQKCSLRISVINPLYDEHHKITFPYLEYQIQNTNDIPDQYTHIRSVGQVGEFRRQLDFFIPQQLVPQAFDFTVIQ